MMTNARRLTSVVAGVPGYEALANVIKADAEKWGAIGKRLGVKLD